MSQIFDLSSRAVDRLATDNPFIGTYYGVSGHDHAWPDLSPEGAAATARLNAELLDEALACPVEGPRETLARDVLVEHCEAMVERHDRFEHHYDLNNITSTHQTLRFVYGSQGSDTADDWEALLSRLETVDQPLEQYRQTLEEGRAGGRTVSRRQVNTVIEQGEVASGDGSSFHQLRRRLDEAGALTDAERQAFGARLDAAIDAAKAGFGRFNEYLRTTYLPDAVEPDGVGEERYRLNAEMYLGAALDAPATYRWGWDEVERLWSDLQAACAAIDPDVPVAAVIEDLNTNPAYAVERPEEFVEVMAARQQQALANLDGVHFDVPEQIRAIDVQIEPAGGAAAAHYVGPSEDFSRTGSVWYPIEGQTHFPLFREVTIAYHEGFPGHHLQVGLQFTLAEELSRFQRTIAWYPGSGEGWALYAEHLMGELGYLEEPQYVVGLLSSQLMRACRVAIDIGLHLDLPIPDDVTFHPGERWNFDLAYELLTERALESHESAVSEVIRYLGWPGQAISYKVGEQAILDLRAERQAAGNFDPKAFHAEVLSVGSIGLDLMRRNLTSS